MPGDKTNNDALSRTPMEVEASVSVGASVDKPGPEQMTGCLVNGYRSKRRLLRTRCSKS